MAVKQMGCSWETRDDRFWVERPSEESGSYDGEGGYT